MTEDMVIFLIGTMAGLVIMAGTAVEIRLNLRAPSRALGQSILRAAAQATGNCLYAIYGYLVGADVLVVMGAIGFTLAVILLFQAMRARRVVGASTTVPRCK